MIAPTTTLTHQPEPRFARIAATIGDATRARTLARLLDGRAYTATELATHAGVAATTMSGHLKLLVDEHLIKVRAQGRHRYFTLADANVAHALEALLRVADSVPVDAARWQRPQMRTLRHARSCYGHLAGELGVQLHDALIAMQWVVIGEEQGEKWTESHASQYRLTAKGLAGLTTLGFDAKSFTENEHQSSRSTTSPRMLYGCMDWSERRDHFAGTLAVALLEHFISQGWLDRQGGSRELRLTATGQRMLANETLLLKV